MSSKTPAVAPIVTLPICAAPIVCSFVCSLYSLYGSIPFKNAGCFIGLGFHPFNFVSAISKPSLAYLEPMPDPTGKRISRFTDIEKPIDCIMNAMTKDFGLIGELARHIPKHYEGLDYVSIDYYVKWWKDKGARIGQVFNGKIKWEE